MKNNHPCMFHDLMFCRVHRIRFCMMEIVIALSGVILNASIAVVMIVVGIALLVIVAPMGVAKELWRRSRG